MSAAYCSLRFWVIVELRRGTRLTKRKAEMRYLYLYDPYQRQFIEFRDITNCTIDEREMQRLELITAAQFPRSVMDSFEDGFPVPVPFGVCLASNFVRIGSQPQWQ
jgi:hypothetical protein